VSKSGSVPHPFDRALALTALPEQSRDSTRKWLGHTDSAYLNMVGPFGGLTAAQALNAVLQHPELQGEPIALTVNFAAALADGPFEVAARPVRTNRSTQHWLITLTQTDAAGVEATTLTASMITAKRRTTWSASDLPMPRLPTPQSIPRGMTGGLSWIQRYELRLCTGRIPTEWNAAETESLTQLWVRDDPPRPLDFCSLTAMSDVFYPRVWLRRAVQTPAGTVSMTLYFHAGAAELAATATGYLMGQAKGQRFFNGFFDQSAQLWNEAGALLATSHQIVYFKE
jgi:acyl-CoA thioesterase